MQKTQANKLRFFVHRSFLQPLLKLFNHPAYALFVSLFIAMPWFSHTALAEPINLKHVLHSALQHHPKILEARSATAEKRALREASLGEFDWQVKQQSFARGSGYYDGRYADQKFVRKLRQFNGELSLGYRISDGDFPVYEQINETLSDGEVNLKLSLSLLRGRSIDEQRGRLNEAELDIDIAELAQQLDANEVLFDAALSYLRWYRSVMETEIAEQALALAENRNKAIRIGVSKGDLAAITLSEFEQSLLNRKASLLGSRQKQAGNAVELGLYLRDQHGEPLELSQAKAPQANQQAFFSQQIDVAMAQTRRPGQQHKRHPFYQQLTRMIERQKNQIRLSENKRLPKLDLQMTVAEDVGVGSETLDGTETYLGLHFSTPIQRREAKGKLSAQKQKLRQLEHKQQMFVDKLNAELTKAQLELDNLEQLRDIRQQQADLGNHLVAQEQRRFDLGESDLFLLNTRERENMQAQMSALNVELQIVQQKLFILSLTADLPSWIKSLNV